ncbi:cysteine-rich with EGF-like domain protein 2 [Copidosoma floridanum]|uniref:cysteine-rich with EGF-like domain protein 2 n=1 Tax=Copidosoma floridanum TaxID=29053 RepID=UPI0006C9AA0B|nr:cysteine-rich with EGF-like domain protein 2 [Copidosoma floridanum]
MKIICSTASLLLFMIFISTTKCDKLSLKKNNNEEAKNHLFPPCASCKILVDSFKRGMEKTKKGKFEGGDAEWEEKKLGSYQKSEIRLVEIQENLCKDVNHGQNQCYSLAEELESQMEEWWFNNQDTHDFHDYLCIQNAKKCCPLNHYGPNCEPCNGFPDSVCNNNGKCKGAGTRMGNGKCTCDKGYTGDVCFECADGFYQSYKDEKKLLCSPCHKACKGSCSGGGPKECLDCTSGWKWLEGKGCYDIDECYENKTSCPENNFCINTEGNYTCLACDRACNGCFGDGPDMCTKCADGYEQKDNICVDTSDRTRKTTEDYYRYARYLGLSVATGIILQRNIYVAAVIGLCVAVYITVSEYTVAQNSGQEPILNLDTLGKIPK